MNQQETDLFGDSQNQGSKYAEFRPNYPKEFYELFLNLIKTKQNYLDMATGTGQVLFSIAEQFKDIRVGADRSEFMLGFAQKEQQKRNLLNNQVVLLQADAHQVGEVVAQHFKQEVKFDLVTVGQALHWFDVERFFQYVSEKLLRNEDSVFAVMAYFQQETSLDIGYLHQNEESTNPIFQKDLEEISKTFGLFFEIFYNVIKAYFAFDQDNFFTYYKDYWYMTKYFSRIQFERRVEKVSLPLSKLIQYIKTMSAYNTFIKQNKIDPAENFQNKILDQYTALMEKFNLKTTEPQLLFNHVYFMYIMRK